MKFKELDKSKVSEVENKLSEKFLDMDCFFTLGPDIAEVCRNRRGEKFGIYRLMMKEIPAETKVAEADM